jgi:hypothetical protein
MKDPRSARALSFHHTDDLWYDLAALLDQDMVSDAHVLLAYLVLVMQCGP